MNQFEFLARAHRALAMYAFSKNMKIISVEVEFNNISISGYVGGSLHVTKFSFPPWVSGSVQRRKRIALFVKTAVTSFDKVALLK